MEHKIFLQLLSDFIDDELDFDLSDEFERELEDEFCCCFFNTFKKTVELCHQIEMQEVPEILHYRIIRIIETTTQKRPAKKTGKRKNK